jgi:Gram-negative bacterial TonB protein C-terminal
MRFLTRLWLFVALVFLAPLGLAECGQARTEAQSRSAQAKPEDRTVLLELTLKRSGAVRAARVNNGPEDLWAAAIKAAKEKKFKHHYVVDPTHPNYMAVAVTFPLGNGTPDIRQAMIGGVPGCVYGGRPIVISFMRQQLFLQPFVPALPSLQLQPKETQTQLLTAPGDTQNTTGSVVLHIVVDKQGNVFRVNKLSGPDAVFLPAIEAVKNWKYEPYLLYGLPVEVETTVELDCFQSIGCSFLFN